MIYTDLIFVFAFLPIYIIAGFSNRETWVKNLISVAASVLFITWGRQWYYALIIIPVFLIYICGLLRPRSGAIFEALGDIVAAASAALGVVMLSADSGLHAVLLSVGFMLFALRSVSYLKYVSSEGNPERDFFELAVYLISLENMLIAPLSGYGEFKSHPRRVTLQKSSAGLTMFIKGFAKAAIFDLSFDAVRLAATEYEAFPWLNAVTLILVTFAEAYIIIAAFLEMSCGLSLISGFSPRPETSAFLPRTSISGHISEMWRSLPRTVRECFSERSFGGVLMSLAVISLMTGVFVGFGSKTGVFAGILILGMTLEGTTEKHSKISDTVFASVILAIAFLGLAGGSVNGVSELLGAINPSAYDYDITYILNLELTRRLPWLILGVISVSPLYRMAAAALRRKMSESDKAYTALKIAETVVCAVLLILAAAAAI